MSNFDVDNYSIDITLIDIKYMPCKWLRVVMSSAICGVLLLKVNIMDEFKTRKLPDFMFSGEDTMFEHYKSTQMYNGQYIDMSVNKMTGEVIFDYKRVLKALDLEFDFSKVNGRNGRFLQSIKDMERAMSK